MEELDKLRREKLKAESKGKWKEVATLCNYLGQLYSRAGNWEDALSAHREELAISVKNGDKLDLAVANRRVGECYIEMGNYKKALHYVKKYLDLSVTMGSVVEQQRAWATLGRAFYYIVETGDLLALDKAENSFIKSLELCEKLKEELSAKDYVEMKARLLLNLGLTYHKRGNVSQCAESIKQAIFLTKKHSLYEDLHRCQYSLASVYEKHGDEHFALKLMDEATNTAKSLHDKALICETFLAKAQIMVSLKDFAGARQCVKKAYKMQTPIESDRILAEKRLKILCYICDTEAKLTLLKDEKKKPEMLEKIGDGLVAFGCYKNAVNYYILTLELLQKLGTPENELSAIYYSIAQTYADDGCYDKALEYFQKEFKANAGNHKEQCKTLLKIADILEQNSNSNQLKLIHQKALAAAEKCNDFNLQYQCLDRMKNFEEKYGCSTNVKEILERLAEIPESDKFSNEDSECEEVPDIFDELSLSNLSDCSESNVEEEYDLPKRRNKRKLDAKRNEVGETPLHRACIEGNLAMVKRLIENGHTVNPRDNCGWIPLHEACNYGYYEIVQYLLENGAWVNDKGGEMCDGITPLHDAASCGHIDVMKLLIDKGASVTSQTIGGDTALDCLKQWRERAENLCPDELQEYKEFETKLSQMLRDCGHEKHNFSQDLPSTNKLNMSLQSHFEKKTAEKKQQSPCLSTISIGKDDSDGDEMEEDIDEYLSFAPSELFEKDMESPDTARCEYQTVMSNLRKSGATFKCQDQEFKKNVPASALVNEDNFFPANEWLVDDMKQEKFSSKKKRMFDNEFRENKIKHPIMSIKRHKTGMKQLKLSNMENFKISSSPKTDNVMEEQQHELSESTYEHARCKVTVDDGPKSTGKQLFCLKVRVESKLILVPVSNQANTIDWLAEETAKRYYSLVGKRPCLKLSTTDGAFLSPADAIGLILNNGDEVAAVVESWNVPPLSARYEEACSKMKMKQHSALLHKLKLTESSGELQMENIGLHAAKLIKPVASAIQYEKNLRVLNFSSCHINEAAVKLLSMSLTTLPNLTTLVLTCCALTGSSMQSIVDTCFSNSSKIKSLQLLEKLDVSYNSIGPNFSQLASFIQHCSSISSINISGCDIQGVTFKDPSLSQLLKAKSNLQELFVAENELRLVGLAEMFSCLCVDVLSSLNLSRTLNCRDRNFGKLFVKYFSKSCLSLTRLSMCGCHLENRDLVAISEIISLCQNLHTLDISANPGISTASLDVLLQSLYQNNVPINCLHLEGSIDWNFEGIPESFFLLIPKLSKLTLTYGNASGDIVIHLNEAWKSVHGNQSLCNEGPGNFVEFKSTNSF